jgi:hypothetical protein
MEFVKSDKREEGTEGGKGAFSPPAPPGERSVAVKQLHSPVKFAIIPQ